MTIAVDTVITAARTVLQDPNKVRWTDAELVAWLNGGLRDISTLRPDIMAEYVEVPLTNGLMQELPAACVRIMDVINNTAAPRTAVVQISRSLLDLQFPNWASTAPNAVTKHVIYDERIPKRFMVFPPAVTGHSLLMLCSMVPTEVELVSGTFVLGATISLPTRYTNALIDYVLFRAFSKDAEDENYVARSTAHYNLFKSALADEAQIGKAASTKAG